jgi:hypothetical protein
VDIASTVERPKRAIFAYLLLPYSDCLQLLIMKLHKAIIVPALVQLALKQNLWILHLPVLKCYKSTAPNWDQTLSDICQIAKTIVVLVVCVLQQSELRWLPHKYRQSSISRARWLLSEVNGRILYICYYNIMCRQWRLATAFLTHIAIYNLFA